MPKKEHQDAERDQREAEVTRRRGAGDDVLFAQPLEELVDREAEADERERGADDRHQRAVFGQPRALKRHARPARGKFGVHVELEIGAPHCPSQTDFDQPSADPVNR